MIDFIEMNIMALKRKVGSQMGKIIGQTTGKAVKHAIEAADLTTKESQEFTAAFMESFRKELKKKKR